jgi:hypothetical protein
VPTSKHVELHYGYTPVDKLGLFLSLLGLGALVLFVRRRAWGYPARGDESVPVDDDEARLAAEHQRYLDVVAGRDAPPLEEPEPVVVRTSPEP